MKTLIKGFLKGLGFYLGCAFGAYLENIYNLKEEALKENQDKFQKNLEMPGQLIKFV